MPTREATLDKASKDLDNLIQLALAVRLAKGTGLDKYDLYKKAKQYFLDTYVK